MAIEIKYMEGTKKNPINREKYAEGPFVIVNCHSGWRVEVDYGGACPALPDSTIRALLLEKTQYSDIYEKTRREEAVEKCDYLNLLAKDGHIVKLDSIKNPGMYCYIAGT